MTLHRPFLYGAAAAAALVATGCSGEAGPSGPSSLAVTTTLSAGDGRCPDGGARIDTGVDDGSNGAVAGNGVLEAGEIRSTQYVCVPSVPASSLVKTTPVAAGDENCDAGGVRIDTGLDDGSGGGIAANGVLEPGEVTSTTYSCKEALFHVGSYDPPAGAEGPFRIDAKGGDASTVAGSGSSGGNGGHLEVYFAYGSGGGHVKLFRTGFVDASFTVPARPSFDFGDTPLEVPASTTVHVRPVAAVGDTTDLGGGTLRDGDVVADGSTLYVWHDAATHDLVSGVHVRARGTLVLDHVDGAPTTHTISVPHAFVNEGRVEAGRDAAGTADGIDLRVSSFWSEPGSAIDLSGGSLGAGTPGGNGGALSLSADLGGGTSGVLVNQGTIDTSGGDGDDGGDAGAVTLWSNGTMVNTGPVLARGGNAVTIDHAVQATSGGTGGVVDLETGWSSLSNGGDIDASGGHGSQSGGDAGRVILRGGESGVGRLLNTGALTAKGGDADPSCNDGSCQGGYGGQFDLETRGGDIRSSGDLTSSGGDGRSGTGGNGHAASGEAGISITAWPGSDSSTVGENDVAAGSIVISGNLGSSGGHGEVRGGEGGYVEIASLPYYVPMGQEVVLLGYGGGVDTSGGAGDARGGDAGSVMLYQDFPSMSAGPIPYPAGGVVNYGEVTSRGGDATSGTGGNGGLAGLASYFQSFAVGSYGWEQVINHGRVDVSGGSGGALGGATGFVVLYGLDGVTNSADLTAEGGDATLPDGTGGSCDPAVQSCGILLLSDRGIGTVNAGALSNDAGSSTADTGAGKGGASVGVRLAGPAVTNSGAISANGGSANRTAGTGGAGGMVVLQSVQGFTTTTAESSASGGAGATPGASGHVTVDGQIIR